MYKFTDDADAWYIRIKRGVMKKRRFKLPKLMRDLDDEDEDDEQGMDGKVSLLTLGRTLINRYTTEKNILFLYESYCMQYEFDLCGEKLYSKWMQ